MARKPRRGAATPRLEPLEPRAMLDGAVVGPPAASAFASGTAERLFVRFDANAPTSRGAADLAAVGGNVTTSYPDGSELVSLAPGADRSRAIGELKADPDVVYAEADQTFQTTASAVYPNNTYFADQWGLNFVNDVDIDAPEAWSVTTGSPSTIVAILDTGIDLNNPAFAGRIWTNPNSSGTDGYTGDVHGWNFVNNSPNVQDNNDHGTHVAGILAATGNTGSGVAGVNWQAQIMPVKVLDNYGNGTTDAAVAGIYFAVQHGAKVINASWGGGPYSVAMYDAILYADSQGVVFVTAAGNDGTNSDVTPSYPGSYGLPNEITVAAIDQFGNLASFSEYGPHTVDLAAPGVNVLSTIPGGFAVYSGTSMSTPYVSGVVSLLAGLYPQWNAEQLKARVLATTKPDPATAGLTITGGIVDAAQALGVAGSGLNGGGAPPAVQTSTSTVSPATLIAIAKAERKAAAAAAKAAAAAAKAAAAAARRRAAMHPVKHTTSHAAAYRSLTIFGSHDLPRPFVR